MTLSHRMLRLPQACEMRGRKPGSHYLDIKAGLCTPPVPIGRNAVAWPEHELVAINQARIAGKTEDEVRELVKQLIAARTLTAEPAV